MSYNSKYKGAEVDALLGNIPNKQDKNLYFTDVRVTSWVSSSKYSDFGYQSDIACEGVTSEMYPEVVFGVQEANTGDYAPICETLEGVVRIFAKSNATITIPTIVITK